MSARAHDWADGDELHSQRMWSVGDGEVIVTSAPGSPGYMTAGVWVLGAFHPGAKLTAEQADDLAACLVAAAQDHRERSAAMATPEPTVETGPEGAEPSTADGALFAIGATS